MILLPKRSRQDERRAKPRKVLKLCPPAHRPMSEGYPDQRQNWSRWLVSHQEIRMSIKPTNKQNPTPTGITSASLLLWHTWHNHVRRCWKSLKIDVCSVTSIIPDVFCWPFDNSMRMKASLLFSKAGRQDHQEATHSLDRVV